LPGSFFSRFTFLLGFEFFFMLSHELQFQLLNVFQMLWPGSGFDADDATAHLREALDEEQTGGNRQDRFEL